MRPQLCAVTLVCVLAACGSKKKDGIPLQEVKNDAFGGYSIKMPVGATQTENEKDRHVWSWSPDNHINSYSCIIQNETLDAFTPDAARKRVEVVRNPTEIKSAAAAGADGLVVELKEDEHVHYRETWVFRQGKEKPVVAICTGPAAGSTITDMATSLQATK
jgi:hypothetical protein